jgi:hypothetical protein
MRARIDRYLIHPPLRLAVPLILVMFFVLWLVFALTMPYGLGSCALLSAACCVPALGGTLMRRGSARQ